MRLTSFLLLASTAFIAACSGPDPGKDPYGTWIGKLTVDEGKCPTSDLSTLRIRGSHIVFSPGNSSKVLHGAYQAGSQHYHAELTEDGMNHTPYTLVFDGYPVGRGIGGMFGSPECRAHITLVRP